MGIERRVVGELSAKISRVKYQTIITAGKHSIIADEPLADGGDDTGMSPYNLLLASLASCTVITLRMYIDRKMWVVDEIKIDLELVRNDHGVIIENKLEFKGDITQEQKKRLVVIANGCPIHKILTGEILINTSL
ncbi:OsmC family protein [Mucilaginibacter segetis]|uniref:OsmC family protein n=1 Tax=Mucilaginibacter segetis TaxID=2793071 RepID=A0A934UM97_9SPHI|nr:OsmC family protein [Mucilaginibacter segetis]MBK0379418.1 OsmC family protein [Mucilaginibacter segetis]